jgi:hypothetical protein
MGGFRFAPEKLSLRQVGSSQRLSLLRTASSLAAEAFVAEVERRILATEASSGERQRNRRAMARTQRCQAITAIVANLLLAWSQTPSLATSRTLDANSFTGEDIGYPAFYDAVRWLKAANLMHHRKGGRSKDGTKGSTARFWPSDQLLNLAATYGIDTGTVATDFGWRKNSSEKAPKVRETVVLKVIAAHPNAAAGRNLRIDPHDLIATTLRAEVEALNKFAASVSVEGCRPPRWQRHFRGDFRLYGRLHAVGEGNYQAMPANHRVADIRIAGEPVVEIDIGSSHLSIMHGLMRLPLPEGDLYAVPGFPRSVIKIWINATLGKGSPVRKWPKERLVKTPALADVDPLAVMAAVLGRYPWLAEPWRVASEFAHVADPKRVLPHLLMGVEAEIMLAVAQELRRQGILGLPIHDGILVPASAEAVAYKLIQDIGMREIGVTLRLDVKRPPLVPANSQPFGDFTCLAA